MGGPQGYPIVAVGNICIQAKAEYDVVQVPTSDTDLKELTVVFLHTQHTDASLKPILYVGWLSFNAVAG